MTQYNWRPVTISKRRATNYEILMENLDAIAAKMHGIKGKKLQALAYKELVFLLLN